MKNNILLQVEGTTSDNLITEISKEFIKILDEKISKLHPPPNEDPFITRQDVANMYRITLPTVHSWMNAKILITYKIGNKTRFKLSEVLAAAHNPNIKKKEVNHDED